MSRPETARSTGSTYVFMLRCTLFVSHALHFRSPNWVIFQRNAEVFILTGQFVAQAARAFAMPT